MFTTFCLLIHLSMERHMVFFYLLAIVNDTTVNRGIVMYHWAPYFNSFGYIPGSRIVRLYGKFTFIFFFLRNHYRVFHSDSLFYIPTNGAEGHKCSSFSTPSPILLFLTIVILVGLRWYLTVVLIFHFRKFNDFEHFSFVYWQFLYLLW